VIADASGRAIAFRIVPGQAHELPHAIPPQRHEAPVACPEWIYNRNVVERLWARLKEWRAVATRYEKCRRSRATSARSCSAVHRLFVRQAGSPEPAADGGGRPHHDAVLAQLSLDLPQ
jgi:hypothetical protein